MKEAEEPCRLLLRSNMLGAVAAQELKKLIRT
jgi:hypothetical protein